MPPSLSRSDVMRRPCCALVLLAVAISAQPAAAHPGEGALGGFLAGFSHPVFGYDHLLAMLAVGIWGAQMGGRAVWTLSRKLSS